MSQNVCTALSEEVSETWDLSTQGMCADARSKNPVKKEALRSTIKAR